MNTINEADEIGWNSLPARTKRDVVDKLYFSLRVGNDVHRGVAEAISALTGGRLAASQVIDVMKRAVGRAETVALAPTDQVVAMFDHNFRQ